MKGILFKDLISAKRILAICLFMIICFSFGGSNGVSFAMCYSIIVPMNLLSFDERSRFDRYAAALPLTGLQCVADKYIVTYLCMAMMMVLSSLIVFIRTGVAPAMGDMLLSAALVLTTHALCIPLLIRAGVTKGQWIYLLALAVEFGAVALVGKHGDVNIMEKAAALSCPIFLTALAVNVASMFVAAKMFDQKAEE